MTQRLRYFFTFILGFICSSLMVLYASMMCSRVWQNELRVKLIYELQKNGFEAAHKSDWSKVANDFEVANRIDSAEVGSWKFSFPIYGWSVFHLAPEQDRTFELVHDSVIAYALEHEGKKDEADAVFSMLQSRYPAKSRQYFESVAKGAIGGSGP
ncbi:Uncharacterised protein [Burkholderia pseudomallei]|uniref:hypothetical protein n=1 Tax=Burkholderia pseudomallei TaxID=28450 RepID=UPI000F256AB2|nr:hypothetical protein [Burkholderia pseudomallei]CAJ8193264.1 Uncharacterised protein [Burkholderia pseudomallei]VCJ95645.1 Uncharacterised protein [Burkholderia pseudomallei]VCK44265.1 Uncharacterised protein [Burkholderia pseudomallei]VCK44500.1 Uncharacterised protein [Burkholderia pseudomallei]